jgi:hypothetical protein
VAVILHFTDPDRILKQLQRRLAQGDAVTLIDKNGPPGWFHVIAGQERLSTAAKRDGPFSVSTLELGLVELMPDPQVESYRFRVMVRHEDGTIGGRVGIYVAHSRYATPKGVEHCFCELSFDDQQDKTGVARRDARGRKISDVSLRMRRYREGEGLPVDMATSLVPAKYFTPAAPVSGAGQWRELILNVTPEKIEAWWDEQKIGEMSYASMRTVARKMFQDPLDPVNIAVETSPRNGLGLIIARGTATFHSAVIDPLLK